MKNRLWFVVGVPLLTVAIGLLMWNVLSKAQKDSYDLALVKFFEEAGSRIPDQDDLSLMADLEIVENFQNLLGEGPKVFAEEPRKPTPQEKRTQAEESAAKYKGLSQEEKDRLRNAYVGFRSAPVRLQDKIRRNFQRYQEFPLEKRRQIQEDFKRWQTLSPVQTEQMRQKYQVDQAAEGAKSYEGTPKGP